MSWKESWQLSSDQETEIIVCCLVGRSGRVNFVEMGLDLETETVHLLSSSTLSSSSIGHMISNEEGRFIIYTNSSNISCHHLYPVFSFLFLM